MKVSNHRLSLIGEILKGKGAIIISKTDFKQQYTYNVFMSSVFQIAFPKVTLYLYLRFAANIFENVKKYFASSQTNRKSHTGL